MNYAFFLLALMNKLNEKMQEMHKMYPNYKAFSMSKYKELEALWESYNAEYEALSA